MAVVILFAAFLWKILAVDTGTSCSVSGLEHHTGVTCKGLPVNALDKLALNVCCQKTPLFNICWREVISPGSLMFETYLAIPFPEGKPAELCSIQKITNEYSMFIFNTNLRGSTTSSVWSGSDEQHHCKQRNSCKGGESEGLRYNCNTGRGWAPCGNHGPMLYFLSMNIRVGEPV